MKLTEMQINILSSLAILGILALLIFGVHSKAEGQTRAQQLDNEHNRMLLKEKTLEDDLEDTTEIKNVIVGMKKERTVADKEIAKLNKIIREKDEKIAGLELIVSEYSTQGAYTTEVQ